MLMVFPDPVTIFTFLNVLELGYNSLTTYLFVAVLKC